MAGFMTSSASAACTVRACAVDRAEPRDLVVPGRLVKRGAPREGRPPSRRRGRARRAGLGGGRARALLAAADHHLEELLVVLHLAELVEHELHGLDVVE